MRLENPWSELSSYPQKRQREKCQSSSILNAKEQAAKTKYSPFISAQMVESMLVMT